jgi:tetratricopeptide (TPR) repeat protein
MAVIAGGLVALAWLYLPEQNPGGVPRLMTSLNADNTRQFEALALADQLVQDIPDDPQALFVRGLILNRFVAHEDAIRCWLTCLEQAPDHPEVHYWLGKEYLRKGDYSKAVANYRLAWKLGSQQADVRIQLADILFDLGRFEEAVAALKEQVRLAPRVTAGYYYLAHACFQLGRLDDAAYYYRWALDTNVRCSQAWHGLAQISQSRGETDEAARYLQRFRDLQKTSYAGHQQEKRSFDDRQSLEGSLATAYTDAGSLYLARGSAAMAETCWNRAAALDRRATECRMRLVDLYNEQKRNSDMLPLLRELCDIEPGNPSHCLNLGLLHMTLADFDDAERAFSRLIGLAPDRVEGYVGLARLYLGNHRNPEDTVKLAQKAVQLRPDAENYFLLGRAFAASGDRSRCREAIACAIELDPANSSYQAFQEQLQGQPPENQ